MSEDVVAAPLLSSLVQEFCLFARVEANLTAQSVQKYSDCLRQVVRMLGDRSVTSYSREDLLRLKESMMDRNLSASRQATILLAFRRFLSFCKRQHDLGVLDPTLITPPKRPRKEVLFLTSEEVEQFVAAIKLRTLEGHTYVEGLRFRTLVEVLLGSAMRIGEVLALNRDQIDFKTKEAKIVGKAGKERTVFFTDRALTWITRYLEARSDDNPALFVTRDTHDRLKRPDIWRFFKRYQQKSGLKKPVRAHLLRHTAATKLLFNGCPIGHIKEILGHERLETTCRYYLGLDHRAAKAAHQQYLVYDCVETKR
jgi:site-specific recombinase XerD